MKKIFFTLAAGFIFAATAVSSASAQRAADSPQNGKHAFIYAKNENKPYGIKNASALHEVFTDDIGTDAANNNTADTKTISKKAIKNFTAEFRTADQVKWFKITDGFIAYCTVNGVRNRTHYDKKGNWLYSTQYYDEKKLPENIRTIVRKTYYDFSIIGAQEIHIEDKIVYLIYMNNETTCQTVSICDEEMEVTNRLQKMR